MNLRKLSVLLAITAITSLTAKKDKDAVLDIINQKVSLINKNVAQIKDDIQCQTTIKKPKLTFVLITEETPYNIIPYLQPYLVGGLGLLINNGMNYIDATYAEANPSTGPGHAAMSTGALGQVHGIVNNTWFTNGLSQPTAADRSVLSGQSLSYVANTSNGNPPGQTYPLGFRTSAGNGFSNRNLLADTLADQLTFYSTPQSRKQFYYVTLANKTSSNSYLPAGQLGKPFCFDDTAGGFTSTQAFFPSVVVTITDATGVNARADAWVVDGVVTAVVIENGGTGYSNNPTITITNSTYGPTGQIVPPTTPATATATVVGGVITAINVTNGGAGYVGGLPDWVVNWNNAQGFNTMTSYVQNLLYPVGSPAYNLPNILNYSFAFAPSIIDPTTGLGIPQPIVQSGQPLTRTQGSGATAVANLTQTATFTGSISGTTLTVSGITGTIVVGNVIGGTGVVPGTQIVGFTTGTGGNGTYSVSTSQTVTSTAMFASDGSIASITVTNGGSGYTSGASVTITGITSKGSLASATATVSGGVVTAVNLVTPAGGSPIRGSGYLNPVATIFGGNNNSSPLGNYTTSPDALHRMFDFIETLLDNNLGSTDELVIFCNCLVNFPAASYGIQALDAVDMMYHLDKEFGDFINAVYQRIDPSDVLFGWISDEGADSVLEYWQQAGYANAVAYNPTTIRNTLNAAILTATGVASAVNSVGIANVWMNPIFFQQPAATQQVILQVAQNTLQNIPGVDKVYISSQLPNTPFTLPEEDQFLTWDYFAGRSGQLMYSTFPLTSMGGTTGDERTGWDQDNHVPLILYQQGQFEHKTISDPVYIQQLPITLSQILGVPRPSGAPRVFGTLPGIFCNSSK